MHVLQNETGREVGSRGTWAAQCAPLISLAVDLPPGVRSADKTAEHVRRTCSLHRSRSPYLCRISHSPYFLRNLEAGLFCCLRSVSCLFSRTSFSVASVSIVFSFFKCYSRDPLRFAIRSPAIPSSRRIRSDILDFSPRGHTWAQLFSLPTLATMAPTYTKVPSREDSEQTGSSLAPQNAHMATTTLKVEGMT